MKMLVICQYYYPEEFQINEICESLVKNGHKVTVLTGLPNYPSGIIPKKYQNGKKRDEVFNGVHIIRVNEIPRKKGIIGLGINYISYAILGTFKALCLKKDFDVIYIYQLSPILMAIPGIILKKIFNKKLYLYCCDLWPESIRVMDIKKSSLIFTAVKWVSSLIYRNCDFIGVQAESFYDYFINVHKIAREKLVYIPQFARIDGLHNIFSNIHKGINLIFLGNVGLAQNLDCLIKATKINSELGIKYLVHIVGDGSYLADMKEIVKELGIENYFIFYGRKPSSEMTYYYKLADACILTLKGDSFISQTIPLKLQGYMAAGKFVLAAVNGSAKKVIEKAKCGMVVQSSDIEGFAAIIRKFIDNKNQYLKYGLNGRKYCENNFTKKSYLDKTEMILQRLASN